MTGYAWPSATGWVMVLAYAGLCALLGPWIARARPARHVRVLARLLVGSALLVPFLVTPSEAAGTRLLLLCVPLFLAMKVLVQAEAQHAGHRLPSGGRWLAFAFLWPGMRPWSFAGPRAPTRDGLRWLVRGTLIALSGVGVLLVARALRRDGVHDAWVAIVAMLGLGLVIAFGIFQMAAGFWRLRGRPVVPLFDAPARSRTLEEFWSRRWNRAFSEMLQVAVERPLRRRVSRGVAWSACFVVSGALHELAFSVPARAGYGLPMLYFVLHALLVAAEQRIPWPGGAGGRALSRAWTAAWVLLPVPLVFHLPAMRALVLPLLDL